MAPSSQKAADRPIGFLLTDDVTGDIVAQDLIIRPEELTRTDPSSLIPTRTFGGAWFDDWGSGIATINISGHTGWRGGPGGDGIAQFLALKDTVFTSWHQRRAAARAAGSSGDLITLQFSDALDQDVSIVAPTQFVLRRSRSRPLLMMYQIGMVVLAQDDSATQDLTTAYGGGNPSQVGTPPAPFSDSSLGLDSLNDSIGNLTSQSATAISSLPSEIQAGCQSFVTASTGLFGAVSSSIAATGSVISDAVSQAISVAQNVAQAGSIGFSVLAGAVDGVTDAVAALGFMAREFTNIFCVLENAFQNYLTYIDISDLYGASNCSSTSGGSPLSPLRGVNAFDALAASVSPIAGFSALAQSSVSALNSCDPILLPIGADQVGFFMGSIGAGITLP